MSDVETQVFSSVSKYAKSKFPALTCASASSNVEPTFPFALIQMVSDRYITETITSNHVNEARRIRFDVNVYSASPKAPKIEAKRISSVISDAFHSLGFVQTAGGEPIDLTDEKNRAIVRYFSRFEAAIQNNEIHTI